MAGKDSGAQARQDRREAERQARHSTGKAQPLKADRPVDRLLRKNSDKN